MPRQAGEFRFYAEIQRQPEELERLLDAPEPVDLAAGVLGAARRVFTIGIGTSWNAACAAAFQLRGAGIDARAWSSYDFATYPPAIGRDDAVMVFTHSGAKQYSRAGLELAAQRGAPAVLVTSAQSELGVGDLPLNATVLRTTQREPSSVFTASHTAAMLLAARVADAIQPGAAGDLRAVPDAVADALALEDEVAELAGEWAGRRALVALGAGPHEVAAHEAAIKIAEAARRPVRAHAVEQFLHGPQVAVGTDEAFLFFAAPGPGVARTEQALAFVRALGCDTAWIAPQAPPDDTRWLRLADAGEPLAPIVEAVPAQLLAAHCAALADVDGDAFRMDDPAFKAARNAIQL